MPRATPTSHGRKRGPLHGYLTSTEWLSYIILYALAITAFVAMVALAWVRSL